MAFVPGRWNRRSLLGMGGALVAARLGLGPQAASAGRAWCRSDPVALIDGQLADIFSSAPLDAPLHVTGPTQIVVTAPQGVNALLASPGVGFGRGENVRFAHSRKLKQTARGIQLKIA